MSNAENVNKKLGWTKMARKEGMLLFVSFVSKMVELWKKLALFLDATFSANLKRLKRLTQAGAIFMLSF